MKTLTKVFKKIKDKLTPKERIVLLYASGINNSYSRSIDEIATLFGTNKEDITQILNGALKKFPNEISELLNLEII